jgi:beta-lactamase class A
MKYFKVPDLVRIALCLLPLLINSCAQQRKQDLKKTIETIAGKHAAKIGFSVIDLQNGNTIGFNGKVHYPM